MIEVREARPEDFATAGHVAVEGYREFYGEALGSYAASRDLYEALGFRRDPDRDYRPDKETFLVCYVLDLTGG